MKRGPHQRTGGADEQLNVLTAVILAFEGAMYS